jgi:hypothetical protein
MKDSRRAEAKKKFLVNKVRDTYFWREKIILLEGSQAMPALFLIVGAEARLNIV